MEMIISPGSLLMTSREIAELTGKRHPDVKRDIETMMADLKEDVSKNARIYRDSMNRQQAEYLLDRELTDTLLTGYSAVLRRKVIARWRELELEIAVPAIKTPKTFSAALRLAAEQAEIIEEQAAKITSDAPKVFFAETIRAIDGVCHIEKVAKTIGIGRTKFFRRLRDDHILISGSNLPYQKYIDKGYFTVIEGKPFRDRKGVEHPTFTAMVTGAGQVFLVRKYAKAGEAEL
jgi:anti-repressor protein